MAAQTHAPFPQLLFWQEGRSAALRGVILVFRGSCAKSKLTMLLLPPVCKGSHTW